MTSVLPCFRRGWFALLLVVFAAATASASPPSDANAADKAAAQALFDDAIKLMASKRFAEAGPKLEESERLAPAIGTRYQLAQCYEALGRTASAWAAFLEVADLARASGQEARERAARERAATMEAKVDRLIIDVTPPTRPGLLVRRDDVVLGPAQWGVPIPVDPGVHHITATAASAIPFSTDVTISGAGETIHVRVPRSGEVVPLAEAPVAPTIEARRSDAASASKRSSYAPQRMAAGVLGAVGVLALAGATVMAVVAHSNYDDTGDHCQPAGCDSQGKDITDSARRLGNAATAVFLGGAALVVTGGVLWFTSPRPPTEVSLEVGPTSMRLVGRF